LASAVSVARTNNPEIDGLLSGSRWSGTVTYSFPDSPSDYPASYSRDGEPTTTGFAPAPVAMQTATNYAVALVSSYTNISIQFAGSDGSDIAVAKSPAANPTSYAYYPANAAAGGDVWFGNSYDYSQAQLGNYYFDTAMHELGHSLGLKHSQETGGVAGVAVPSAHDESEYTIMSYRSYADGPLNGYTAEAYGYAQTYMANDILALQTLYGANYTTHSEDTVYSWSPATGQQFINGVAQLAPGGGSGGSSNRIFETVWDGGGVDTYDFSNYTTALRINLDPGASSTLSAAQIANLGNGHYAAGNIYNAYLFEGDPRSYIDNAIGGSSDDSITGNAIANALTGGGGNDMLTGGGGNDHLVGGSGADMAVFSGNQADYLIGYDAAAQTFAVTDQRGGAPDGTDTVSEVEGFQFADSVLGEFNYHNPCGQPRAGSDHPVGGRIGRCGTDGRGFQPVQRHRRRQ
jgi:serralysin